MGTRPRSIRSSLTTVKICSGTGRASKVASLSGMGAAPSAPLAALMALNQSPLLGAMLAAGLAGGRIPAAPAEAARVPEATTPREAATIQLVRRKRRAAVVRLAAWFLFCCGVVFMSSIVGVMTPQLMMRPLSWRWCKRRLRLVHLHQEIGDISPRRDGKWLVGSRPLSQIIDGVPEAGGACIS